MSQWSEKISKENLSKTVSSTRYLFTSFSKAWVQINNFRKSSKKFIIDLLTKNVALNLSGAIFFVGLGYSLKWWYKDQLFVVLLKQNLPALSESQQNISWETGESILNTSLDEYTSLEYQTWMPHASLIDRIDLYANHIRVKFKQPWQKHVYERFIGVFGEPAQANVSKQVLTIPRIKALHTPIYPFGVRSEPLVINEAYISSQSNVVNKFEQFSIYTPHTQKKPIFPKKWFKLSPRNLCFLNTPKEMQSFALQKEIISILSTKQRSPLFLSSKFSNEAYIPSKTKEYPSWGSWRSKIVEQDIQYPFGTFLQGIIHKVNSKLSYPLQLTKRVAGWQPSPNLLVLNSYLDEIPYKLENASQSYFPKKDSQLLSLSTSFRESPRFLPCIISKAYDTQKTLDLFKETTHFLSADVKSIRFLPKDLNGRNDFAIPNASLPQRGRLKQSETYLKKLHFFETKKLLQNQFTLLINSFPINFVGKSQAIVEKDKHSHTGDKVIKVDNRTVVENNKYAPYPFGVQKDSLDSNIFATSVASEMGSNIFTTNKLDINVVNNSHQNVTKKILAVKTNTQKGVILPSASQTHYVQSKVGYPEGILEYPTLLRTYGMPQRGIGISAEGYWGTEIDRLRKLFACSTVANVADAEGLDPLLLLNTLGFTFNNFSLLTNPPILLSYDKLSVVSNPSLHTPYVRSKEGACPAEGYSTYGVTNLFKYRPGKDSHSATSVSFAPKDFRLGQQEDKGNIRKPLLPSLPFLSIEDLYKSISFYFHPKNLNWVVFQHSTNDKFNLLVKKIASEISKEDIQKEYSLITSNQPIPTPSINLMFEFLKGRTSLSYVYPFGFAKGFLPVYPFFASHLWGMQNNGYPNGYPEGILEDSLLRQHKDFVQNKEERMSKARRLLDLIKINTVINKVDIKQKETKLETLNEINVVDKYINFDKNSRFMSGYVYPDIQSNSLKAFLYQWLSKNKNLMPWFSSHYHYLNEKPIAGFNYQLTNIVDKACLFGRNISRDKIKGTTLATATPTIFDSLHTPPIFDVPLVNSLDPLAKRTPPGSGMAYPTRALALPRKSMQRRGLRSRGVCEASHYTEKNGLSNQFLRNTHYMGNIEVPYKKFNHYLAQFPGFSDPNQFVTTLPQISCGNENLVLNNDYDLSLLLEEQHAFRQEESQKESIYNTPKDYNLVSKTWGTGQRNGEQSEPLLYTPSKAKEYSSLLGTYEEMTGKKAEKLSFVDEKVSRSNDSINIVDKSEINKKFIQKNGCDFRKVAYSGIVVQRNKWTKDFQPFICLPRRGMESISNKDSKDSRFLPKKFLSNLNGPSKSSIWGTLFLGPENPLTDRQCHFFGQKQLSTVDTNSLQRDYLRQLGKEILTQSNSKGYTELSKFSSIERTKILSLSKKVNSFFFKRRKYSYLLEPKDQWHLLFQEQLCTALEDCKKYPLSTIRSFEETNIEKLNGLAERKLGSGRIKVSAPLVMARFPKKLVQSRSLHNKQKLSQEEYISSEAKEYPHAIARENNQLERGISWRPLCHLQRSFIYAYLPLAKQKDTLCFAPKDGLLKDKWENTPIPFRGIPYPFTPYVLYPFTPSGYGVCKEGACPAEGYGVYKAKDIPSEAKEYSVVPFVIARGLVQQADYPHYPLFTERFNEEINTVPYLNKNSLFYSANISSYPSGYPTGYKKQSVRIFRKDIVAGGTKNMRNNLLGIQNMCTSLLIQEPLNCNSWAVLNQWVFLIALLFWVEQTLLNNVFPALFALEEILLSAAGLKTGENNRTHALRISKNETPKFQNLAGIDGLLGELSELVLFLRGQRNLGERFWNKKNSYGVLLTGSPGTGKTFLVRALANEAKVPVLILSASTLTASKLNNNKPSWSIRHAFKRAKQLAPCILFIDEIDALGKSRGKIVTDINEIVADTNLISASFLTHKRMLTKFTPHSSSSPIAQQMFSYEQFGQNCSNFNATLLNKWEYPLQSTILQESNEINQNSLCQEKLVNLLKIAGPGLGKLTGIGSTKLQDSNRKSSELIDSSRSKKENTSETKSDDSSYSKGLLSDAPQEKEMTRGKFGPLTQLLVSMDGINSFSGVLIMGATNRPELLDPALTRPGRFEKIIRIDKPSEQNRIEILQLYSQNLGIEQQIPWSYLATRTIGLTTADLAVAMNYSSLRAIIQDSVHTLETIEYGLNCITRL